MKALIITSFADSLVEFRGELIKSLVKKDIDVHVAAPHLSKNIYASESLKLFGAKIHDVCIDRTGTNPLSDIRSIWSMFKLNMRIKPDLVLGYAIKPVIYGTLAAWIAGVPKRFVVITGLGWAFTKDAAQVPALIAQWLYKLALARTDKVFFQNPDDHACFRTLMILQSKTPGVVVNGSGVDLNRFRLASFPIAEPRFLMMARLLGEKGVREYAEAAKRIKILHPKVTFSLAGWLDENPSSIKESELNEWIQSGAINYLGRLSDVRKAISESHVYVLPSYREGTPRSILEAMAMGRPIITTNAPGCRQTVVEGVNGFLVPVGSITELVDAMIKFINDPKLAMRMGSFSRKLAEDTFDVCKVNELMFREMGL